MFKQSFLLGALIWQVCMGFWASIQLILSAYCAIILMFFVHIICLLARQNKNKKQKTLTMAGKWLIISLCFLYEFCIMDNHELEIYARVYNVGKDLENPSFLCNFQINLLLHAIYIVFDFHRQRSAPAFLRKLNVWGLLSAEGIIIFCFWSNMDDYTFGCWFSVLTAQQKLLKLSTVLILNFKTSNTEEQFLFCEYRFTD